MVRNREIKLTTTLIEAALAEVRRMKEVAEKATPAPWRWCGYYLMQDCPRIDGDGGKEDNPYWTPCGRPIASDGSAGGEYTPDIDIEGADAVFIVSARNHGEAILALLEALLELREWAGEESPRDDWWLAKWNLLDQNVEHALAAFTQQETTA